ncbi:polysaccharide biosynthesis tyrosine autokinase [Promicromonospora vindobonensis]|uniref:non-specific protein-tyrosine kinase n=1 Tax=Promicromonospora vindobonensis TaxID=195748 RepID=A0ABW5VRG5_9MICO
MKVIEYLRIIRRRWIPVVALALAGIVLASLFALTRTPTYTTTSQVFVSFHGAEPTSEPATGTTYVQRRLVSYADLVRSPQLLQPVVDELGLDTDAGELGSRVQAAPVTDTVLIDITATDADPAAAARIANAVAASLAERVDELETPQQAGASPVRLQLAREAAAPSRASYPNIPVLILAGLLLGTALGVALAALREIADTRVRSEQDLRRITDSAVIGTVTMDDEARRNPLAGRTDPYRAPSEAFRRLGTNLQYLDLDGGPQALVVTSSVPDEGKTTSAINLAITLADANAKVLLIDADLRRPSVAWHLGIEESVGLTTLLIQRATIEDVVQPWGSAGLFVIPSGAVPPNPAELVGSKAMARLILQMGERFDYVIIDTPPLLQATDAALIARMTTGVLVVAGTGRLRREQLRQSLANLSAVSARVLGIVLNVAGRTAEPTTPTRPTQRTLAQQSARTARETQPVSVARPPRLTAVAEPPENRTAHGLPVRRAAPTEAERPTPAWAPVRTGRAAPGSGPAPTSELRTLRVSDRTRRTPSRAARR